MNHTPVLLKEVLSIIDPVSNGRYIDATVGDGGHTAALLEASSPNGKVLGIDQDEKQIRVAKERLQSYENRVTLVTAPFSRINEIAQAHSFSLVDAILFDLGISSRQLDDPTYGLSLMKDASPLDMRLSKERPTTAADILNSASDREIADLLYQYGDRHNSRTLARKIVAYRRKTPFQVAHDLKEALQLWNPGGLAPIFQALRMAVNNELEEIEAALPQSLRLLRPGGKIVVISFHSGEDRVVKRFFRQYRELLEVPKHIIRPTYTEIRNNPRSRSAVLRYGAKLNDKRG